MVRVHTTVPTSTNSYGLVRVKFLIGDGDSGGDMYLKCRLRLVICTATYSNTIPIVELGCLRMQGVHAAGNTIVALRI